MVRSTWEMLTSYSFDSLLVWFSSCQSVGVWKEELIKMMHSSKPPFNVEHAFSALKLHDASYSLQYFVTSSQMIKVLHFGWKYSHLVCLNVFIIILRPCPPRPPAPSPFPLQSGVQRSQWCATFFSSAEHKDTSCFFNKEPKKSFLRASTIAPLDHSVKAPAKWLRSHCSHRSSWGV